MIKAKLDCNLQDDLSGVAAKIKWEDIIFVAIDMYTPFPVGSLVKMKAEFGGENWGTGLIVQYLSPHAKAYEPAGMYQVKWSSGPEADTAIEDCWYDARHIELIAQPAQGV